MLVSITLYNTLCAYIVNNCIFLVWRRLTLTLLCEVLYNLGYVYGDIRFWTVETHGYDPNINRGLMTKSIP
jgi:hypothetical protein